VIDDVGVTEVVLVVVVAFLADLACCVDVSL
jgi:hypothetical protein